MTPTLHLLEHARGRSVRVVRGEGVDEDLWLSVRSRFGSGGPDPGREVLLDLEQFLRRFRWLADWPGDLQWAPRLAEQAEKALAQSSLLEQALAGSQGASEAPDPPGRFIRALKPFQKRDLSKLVRLPHGANFSVTGGGKTAVTLACYETERTRGRVAQLLLVAPYSAFESWETEVAKCFGDGTIEFRRYEQGRPLAGAEVVVVAYQRLLGAYSDLAEWMSQRPTMLVVDEAHRAKRGKAGVWGRACLELGFLAERRDVLTGTPAPNSIEDLRALLEFLWHSDGMRLLSRRDEPHTADQVGQLIAPLFTRTTKAELELPKLTVRVLRVQMGRHQEQIYRALAGTFAGEIGLPRRDAFYFQRLGRVVMYMLQAATNPALLTQGSDRYDPIEFRFPPLPLPADSELRSLLLNYAEHEPPQKFLQVSDLVHDNAERGQKTLVWSNFVRNLTSLRRILGPFQPAMIHGGVPLDGDGSRSEELARFRGDPDCLVLLANPQTLGEGISLHEHCHDAIFIDRTFNAGMYLQSVDRIHRLGLAEGINTTVTALVSPQSIDGVVEARLAEKVRSLSEVLSDPGLSELSLPDEDESLPLVDSLEDILALGTHFREITSARAPG